MKPPSPLQIARYGHAAAKLRAFLAENNMKMPDLNAAIGLPRAHTLSYLWTSARSVPPHNLRAKISEVTGIPEEDLRERDVDASAFRKPRERIPLGERTALGWQEEPKPVPPEAWGRSKPKAPAPHVQAAGTWLAFVGSADGTARVTLDVTLPLAEATRLLQHLLQAGIVQNDEAGVAE